MKYVLIYGGTALISLALCIVDPAGGGAHSANNDLAIALVPFGVVMFLNGICWAMDGG